MEKVFCSLFFPESQNLPLKFGKIRKKCKRPHGDSNPHTSGQKEERNTPKTTWPHGKLKDLLPFLGNEFIVLTNDL